MNVKLQRYFALFEIVLFIVTGISIMLIHRPSFIGMAAICALVTFIEGPIYARDEGSKKVLRPLAFSMLGTAAGCGIGWVCSDLVHLSLEGFLQYELCNVVGFFVGITVRILTNRTQNKRDIEVA